MAKRILRWADALSHRASRFIDRQWIVEPPVVVKIDVEGLEPQVIAGFGKYLSSEVLKAFIFESNGEFYDEISSLLESAGFKCSAIPSANKNETFKTVNFIALRAGSFPRRKIILTRRVSLDDFLGG